MYTVQNITPLEYQSASPRGNVMNATRSSVSKSKKVPKQQIAGVYVKVKMKAISAINSLSKIKDRAPVGDAL